ncbi:MAG TPA: hypothetical protein VMK12_00700 [Anaeromyxobacteraceae bacterium]|nr:hypothetical protein [Anaeromyxobacteraceae bacterium]
MHVQKTALHEGRTLAHGTFQVNETIHICATGCTKAGLDGKPVRALTRRQPEVAALLLPRSSVGYDVMTFVGLERATSARRSSRRRAISWRA